MRDLPLQSLATVSRANAADMQPLMSKLDTLLRSLLADFSTDNAGKLPDAACICCSHATASCTSRNQLLCARWNLVYVVYVILCTWSCAICRARQVPGKDRN